MNDVSFAFGFLCVLALVVIVGFALLGSGNQNRQALEVIAKKFKGRIATGGFLEFDEVMLPMGDSVARLHFSRNRHRQRYTHLSVAFPDPQLRVELRAAGIATHLRKLLGMHDIEIGSPAFDEAFIITGNNPTLIREHLTGAAQTAIRELANFSTILTADLHLSISGGQLRVTKHAALNSAGELTRFVSLVEIMFNALAYSRNPGIEIVASSCHGSAPETHCQVCGEALATNIVTCAKCHTPHHLDCWQYFGSCAVYGCGQKRYVSGKR